MQCLVHGTASSRFALISLPQEMHSPKLPWRILSSALSSISSSWLSLLLWWKRNTLVYELAARSAMSCAESSSTVRPSCSVRETVRRSSCCRTSSLFLKYSNFFLSMDDDRAAGPLPESFLSFSRTKMICAQIEMRQLPQRTHSLPLNNYRGNLRAETLIIVAAFREG